VKKDYTKDKNVVHRISNDLTNELSLHGDLAAEEPIYIFITKDCKTIYHSKCLPTIIDEVSKLECLSVSAKGLSYLLQDGVIPSPLSIYTNLFILSVGDQFIATSMNGEKWQYHFENHFPFIRNTNLAESKQFTLCDPNSDRELLRRLAQSIDQKTKDREILNLFHSAGKDSNVIAIALAEAGKSSTTESLTYKALGEKDESEIVAKVCKKLGFNHTVIDLMSLSDINIKERINHYFDQLLMPSMDNAALLYPLISDSLNTSSTIIDGMGNDLYIGHVPTKHEYRLQQLSPFLRQAEKLLWWDIHPFRRQSLSKTRAHITGLNGFSGLEVSAIFDKHQDTYDDWKEKSKQFSSEDYFQFRARIRGGYIDTEKFVRKLRAAGDVYQWKVLFPWMNESVASLVFGLNEADCFDRKRFKNKIFIRDLLKKYLDLDSDKLGKKAFSFDYYSVLNSLGNDVKNEILSCQAWNKSIAQHYDVLALNSFSYGPYQSHWQLRLYRLYLISAWLNHRGLKVF
tara:strand:+ start:7356 stop:8894 length:1539 start_codon:yes stop_codon:yes gene_type:complete